MDNNLKKLENFEWLEEFCEISKEQFQLIRPFVRSESKDFIKVANEFPKTITITIKTEQH